MSHDLVLQTKIGREETLEKFLHTIGKKGTIKDPCAVRLRRVNREEFEARWAQKARALQIDANWIEPGLKLKNFKLFATDMDSTFLNLKRSMKWHLSSAKVKKSLTSPNLRCRAKSEITQKV